MENVPAVALSFLDISIVGLHKSSFTGYGEY